MGKGKGPPVLLSYLLVLLELPRLCLPPWAALAESSCSPTTGINRLLREIGPCRQGTSLVATFTPQLLSLPAEGSRPPSLSLFLHCMWRGKLLSIEIFRTWSGVWEQANQAWPSSDLVCGAEAPHSQTHRPVVGEGRGYLLGSGTVSTEGAEGADRGCSLGLGSAEGSFVLHMGMLQTRPGCTHWL